MTQKQTGCDLVVRYLRGEDRPLWETLWNGYQEFYGVSFEQDLTDLTWTRLLDPQEPMHVLGALDRGGNLLGIAHYIFHRSTWSKSTFCYLNDLFTIREARRRGVARKLVDEVESKARDAGATRLYWLTQEDNTTARLLYDQVADAPGFIQYRKNI